MTVEHSQTIHIEAPPETVWAVYTDVERWPEWTEAMKKIERLDEGPLKLGSTAHVEAAGAPASVFTVTEFTDGRSFTWETKARGVKGVAFHRLGPDGDGTKVTLGVQMSGIMATLLGPMIRSIARRNVRMEAEGLKRRCESQAAA
jgi:carbon monoxide dehydrogenase subunit G